jgi:hypothetical protein
MRSQFAHHQSAPRTSSLDRIELADASALAEAAAAPGRAGAGALAATHLALGPGEPAATPHDDRAARGPAGPSGTPSIVAFALAPLLAPLAGGPLTPGELLATWRDVPPARRRALLGWLLAARMVHAVRPSAPRADDR